MDFQFGFALLLSVSTGVLSFPFITKSKSEVVNMRGRIGQLKNKLETMDQKLTSLESDFSWLGHNFTVLERKWYKHNGHCYYYSEDKTDWFKAENNCRQLGGYMVKFDEKTESDEISSKRPIKNTHYWIGLSDLNEGEYRWSYDQTKAIFFPWEHGWGAKGTNNNCVAFRYGLAEWVDFPCHRQYQYICEVDFC
ncbi:unnamed protein product [Mytilus edulis]|uniref:C-type lectin domain-containing protein n=1 Tax=Mytilus edulis TaxID=6550 RepID=A0A8S3SI94_MYTED|nr:unnamed protein product [Mytilus edulis]